MGLAHAADSSGRLFVVEQAGLIKIVDRGRVLPAPFLDVRNLASELTSGSSERGLLGLAFHPRFRENGFFYVNYTGLTDDC